MFAEWEENMDEGNLSKSMTDMISDMGIFGSDSDLLLQSSDNDFQIISYWLIERAAFYGTRPEFLRTLLQDNFQLSSGQLDEMYSSDVIRTFLDSNSRLISSRRFMLLKELEGSSTDLSKLIRDRICEIDTILKSLVDSKDFKYYAQISSTWLKSLELLAKLLGKLTSQTAQINMKTVNIQNFITVDATVKDSLDTLSKKVPKKYLDIVKAHLNSDLKEVYDITDESYALQRVS